VSRNTYDFSINFSINENNNNYPLYFDDREGGKLRSIKTQDYLKRQLIDIDIQNFNNAIDDFIALIQIKI
jgi:hypothetical protein